jgi:hypothetical protein
VADIQRIIDEVRFRLQSGDCELNDELKRLAGEFAGLCHVVNTRLRRCGDFLKQGLRAEAIQLADAEPNLLESFAMVDFSERTEWDEIVSLYQLPAAEPLLSDVAQDLNEAYSVQQPLEKLLDRHRLLALCRAPLGQRLAVVRKLADADPGSRFWEDDLRDFETARCNELEGEARAASAADDEVALASLVSEISSGVWREPPPASLVQLVKKLAMQVLGDQLQAAYVNHNLDRARMLRDQWNELVPRSSAAGNGVSGNVANALKWLTAEDSKSQALQTQYAKLETLEQTLVDPDASLAELERARKELLKSRRDIPEPLSSRLDGRIRLLRQQAVSGRRRMIAAVSAGVSVSVALSAFFIWANLRHSAANRIANSVEQMVAQGNLHQARELLESNAWMSTMDQYLTAHAKLIEAEKQEETRVATFRAAIDRAQSAASAQQADPALIEADRLAVTIDERRIVDDVKGRLSRAAQDTARDEDNRFQQQLSDMTDLLDRLERLQDSSTPDSALVDLLKAAETKCRDLRQTSARVKPALALHVDAAEARLARVQKAAASAGRRAALIERLTAESSAISEAADPEARIRKFCQSLGEYCEAFPSDPRASHFGEAAKELDLWRGIMRWQQLAGHWKTLLPRTVKEARARAGECNAWLGEHAACPPGPMLREYLSFLSSVVAREEDSSGDEKEGLRQKLLGLFSGPLVEDVEMFVTATGERFYVRGKYEWAEGRPIKYIAGARGEQKSTTIKQADVNAVQSQEAPQTALRRKVRENMARTTLATWDHSLREIAEELRNDRELDPFLRYYFLLRVLDFAKEGNSILAVELEPVIKELQGAAVKLSARWMDPKDDEAQTARKNAQRALISVKTMKGPFDQADERGLEFSNQLFEQMAPAGWLVTDPQGPWECLSAASLKPKLGSALWMVVPAGAQPVASWIKVGDQAAGNQLALANGVKEQLRQGRLLFVRSRLGAHPRDGGE